MFCVDGNPGESLQKQTFDFWFATLPPVREMQQDGRDLNQADLPEVDPEENSAEFMGILIKVTYVE